jgi:hypothetical protein
MIEILKISLMAFILVTIIQSKQSFLTFYHKVIKKLPWYLYKPLGGCYRCFVGQVCLWYYIVEKPFNILDLGFFVSAGIAVSIIYNRIYCLIK